MTTEGRRNHSLIVISASATLGRFRPTIQLQDAPPVAGGWRNLKPPKNAKRVTHPVPKTPKRFRG